MKEKQISKDIASAENIIRHAYNQGYEQGYKQGYDKGKDECFYGKLKYKQGLNDAWECARKIHSLDMFTYDRIFEGYAQYKYIFDNLTASEAIERINKFEKTKDADGGINMTREEAIKILNGMKADNLNLADLYTKNKYDALKMAINALEQEPCEDWQFYFNHGYEQARNDFIKLVDKYRNGGSE